MDYEEHRSVVIDLRDDVVIHVVFGSDSTRMAKDIAQLDRGHSAAARIAETFVFRDQRLF